MDIPSANLPSGYASTSQDPQAAGTEPYAARKEWLGSQMRVWWPPLIPLLWGNISGSSPEGHLPISTASLSGYGYAYRTVSYYMGWGVNVCNTWTWRSQDISTTSPLLLLLLLFLPLVFDTLMPFDSEKFVQLCGAWFSVLVISVTV